MKRDPYFGTGFAVFFPDERWSTGGGFHLVTNRHVVQPGIENGKPCPVLGNKVFLNHKGDSEGASSSLGNVQIPRSASWFFPDDPAYLAAIGFPLQSSAWDFSLIPLGLFVTGEMVAQKQVVEGDPVMFAGLFIQYSGRSKLYPIVRSGTIAMLPDELIDTTLHKPGHIYLAEAHVFVAIAVLLCLWTSINSGAVSDTTTDFWGSWPEKSSRAAISRCKRAPPTS